MTKTQYKRTAVAPMFKMVFSQNTKCAERDSFCTEGQYIVLTVVLSPSKHLLYPATEIDEDIDVDCALSVYQVWLYHCSL